MTVTAVMVVAVCLTAAAIASPATAVIALTAVTKFNQAVGSMPAAFPKIVKLSIKYKRKMKIKFIYDLGHECDNLSRGFQSINHGGVQSAFTQRILDSGIEKNDKEKIICFCSDIIKQNKINISEKIEEISKNWNLIEESAFKVFKKLFKEDLPFSVITAYLSLNDRSAYNFQKHYFYVAMDRTNGANRIILHEMLHFYTYQFLMPEFVKKEKTKEEFNDFKEALTVLLNIEFINLLKDHHDQGYEKQRRLREKIATLWPSCRNVYDLYQRLYSSKK